MDIYRILMVGSVNKTILLGNLGRDPEIRSMQSGAKMAIFAPDCIDLISGSLPKFPNKIVLLTLPTIRILYISI